MPSEPNATGAVFASRAIEAAYSGANPRLAMIAAVIATGAPNPAIPSIRAPKENAMMSAWSLLSVVSEASDSRTTSK